VGQFERAHDPEAGKQDPAPSAATAMPRSGTSAAHALRLQRQLGNRAATRLLARDTVTMRPEIITSSQQPVERGVAGLDQLRGLGVDPNGISIERDAEALRRNSPQGDRVLPFSGADAWDAQAILTALGQYDTNAQTDSDALRCVQSAALASRIVRGPQAVASFLSSVGLDGMLSAAEGGRQRAALAVLRYVRDRIIARRATFGDLSWVQEAMHDLYYNDVSGTPLTDILRRFSPLLDLTFTTEARTLWCDTPEAVIAAAGQLAEGEQFLLNTWSVAFNEAFEQLESEHVPVVPVGRSQTVNIDGRNVRLRHIDASQKPAATAIDARRDSMHGHQLLIINDRAVGGLRLYEPEMTNAGTHLMALTADVLRPYFRDMPEIQMYNYMEILGKLTPSRLGSPWAP
jgi:hypothetical protein